MAAEIIPTMKTELQANLLALFAQHIAEGIASWAKAGEIVVDLIDNHSMEIATIAEAVSLGEDIVGRFEDLGRKKISPHLLIADYAAAAHALKLPYSEQVRLKDSPIDVVVVDGAEVSILQIKVENLTTRQCRQVFAGSHVRSPEAQRAYIEDLRDRERSKLVISQVPDTYKVRGKKVTIYRACEFTAGQIANILAEMER